MWIHYSILQNFREPLEPILPNVFNKIDREGVSPGSFLGAIITLNPKPDEDPTKRENRTLISLMIVDGNSISKILAKEYNKLSKRSYIMSSTSH